MFKKIIRGITRNVREALVFGPLYPLRHLAVLLRLREISYPTLVGPIHLRSHQGSDASSFFHIFVKQAYSIHRFDHSIRIAEYYSRLVARSIAPVIIDAGANVGAASLWFACQYPEATIYGIEPDSENVRIARINTQRCANVQIIEAAIGGVLGAVNLVADVTGRADRIQAQREQTGASAGETVEVMTIAQIVALGSRASELFLVKVDIEGFESDLFTGDMSWLDRVGLIMIEPHDWMFPWRNTSLGFLRAIAERRFEVLISEDTLICVNPFLANR